MSLFPAYSSVAAEPSGSTSTDTAEPSKKLETPKGSWLENASFSIKVCQIPLPVSSESIPRQATDSPRTSIVDNVEESVLQQQPEVSDPTSNESIKKRHKRKIEELLEPKSKKKIKKHHHKRSKTKHAKQVDLPVSLPATEAENTHFYIDKKSERGNLRVPTLSRPAVPLYTALRHFVIGLNKYEYAEKKRKKSKKRSKKDRYFAAALVEDDNDTTYGTVSLETKMEEELSKRTAEYNKTLGEDPHNVQVWMEYVRFQDTVCKFERTYRRGGAQGQRVTNERKLSILDKALALNFNSETLLDERCNLVEAMFPGDEVSKQFASMIEKRPRSMALWRGYVAATQCSLSSCTATKVGKLFDEAMSKFHQMRRGAPAAVTRPAEESILELLLHYGMFLRQAGLHEQMWMIVKHYLELNLNLPSIKTPSTISDKKLIELEESIFSTNLPLSELWVRVETLRESAHWLPWDQPTECEDPQRVIFADEVSDMLHPITTPELGFKLAAIAMTLLKVPLLPGRDTVSHWLGLTKITWSIDSVETLLSALFPFSVVDSSALSELLGGTAEIVIGPSYLSSPIQSVTIGQEAYLDFVTQVFRICAESLVEPGRTALYVWWLRFERYLVVLSENNICKELNKKKKIKATIKDFLKQEKNRNNLLFYREYALIEREFGNVDSACSILQTSISTRHQNESIIGIVNLEDRTYLCSLYRTLVELLLQNKSSKIERETKALNVLVSMGHGLSMPTDLSVNKFTPLEQNSAADKFQHITSELLNDDERNDDPNMNGTEHLLPDFTVDWICCCTWIMFLTKTTWDAAAFLENAISKFASTAVPHESRITKKRCQREALFESYVALLHYHCQEAIGSYSVLQDVVRRALKEFPNNIHFLATAVRVESTESSPWWKLKRLLEDTDSQAARIFLVFLAKQRQTQLEASQLDNQICAWLPAPALPVSDASYKNRTSALFRQLIVHPSTKRCPLVWRLYLKFLFRHGTYENCRSSFYRAVEECPWNKALFMDGAKMLPAELQQIQDLLIEKELRLHVTPEELDILRSTDV